MVSAIPLSVDYDPAAQQQQSPTWSDYGNTFVAGAQDLDAAGHAMGRYLADVLGDTELSERSKTLESIAHHNEENTLSGMSPAGLERLQAEITDSKFWAHPLSAAALKTTRMSPALLAAVIPGGIVADGMVAVGAMGAQQMGSFVDSIYKKVDALSDDELAEQSSFYRGLLDVTGDPAEARRQYTQQILGMKPALNFLAGAAAGMVGPAGQLARGISGQAASLSAEAGANLASRLAGGAGEGAIGGIGAAGIQDATLQAALMEGGQQKEFDPHQLANSVLEAGGLGLVQGAVAGGIFHGGHEEKTPTGQPPKGYGTGAVAPPSEAVDIRTAENTVTRDQAPGQNKKPYTKKGGATGETGAVETVAPGTPDAGQAAAIKANSKQEVPQKQPQGVPPWEGEDQIPRNQPQPQPRPEVSPQPEPQAPPVRPQPEPAAPAPAPTDVSAARRIAPEPTPQEVAPVTPEVTVRATPGVEAPVQIEKVASAPTPEAPKPRQVPVREPTRREDGRLVLPSLTERSREADVLTKKTAAQIRGNIREGEKEDAALRGETPKSHKSEADQLRAKADVETAKNILESNTPEQMPVVRTAEDRKALADRLNKTLAEARKAGIQIPKKVEETTPDHLMWLREAQALAGRFKESKGFGLKVEDRAHIDTYLGRETAARAGDFSLMRHGRMVEGDRATIGTGGEGAPVETVSSTNAPRGIGAHTETVEFGGKKLERAKAASGEKLTPQQKLEMIRQRNAELKAEAEKKATPPKAAEAKAKSAVRAEEKAKAVEKAKPEPKTPKQKIEAEAKKVNTEPTEAQKAAGNYEKGHVRLGGLDITIETPKGEIRRGKDANGEDYENKSPYHYGYVNRTEGMDRQANGKRDKVDIALGDHIQRAIDEPDKQHVIVIDQVDPDTKAPDEHKIFAGFKDGVEAMDAYEKGFSDKRGFERIGNMTPMSWNEMKAWLKRGDTTEPLGDAPMPSHSRGSTTWNTSHGLSFEDTLDLEVRGGDMRAEPVKPIASSTVKEALAATDLSHIKDVPGKLIPFIKRRLMESLPDTKVHVIEDEHMATMMNAADPKRSPWGFYDPTTDSIALRRGLFEHPDTRIQKQVLIHEAVHAALHEGINKSEALRANIRRIMNEVADHLMETEGTLPDLLGDHPLGYALVNEHEFLSEALSLPGAQRALAKISVSPELAARLKLGKYNPKNMWDLLVHVVRRMLGLPADSYTMLDAVLRVSDAGFRYRPTKEAIERGQRFPSRRGLSEVLERDAQTFADQYERGVYRGSRAREISDLTDAIASLEKSAAEARKKFDFEQADMRQRAADIIRERNDILGSNDNATEPRSEVTPFRRLPSHSRGLERHVEGTSRGIMEQVREVTRRVTDTEARKNYDSGPRAVRWRQSNDLAQSGDRYWGSAENNPTRRISNLIETIRSTGEKNLKAAEPMIRRLLEASQKHGADFQRFLDLAHDATRAGVHPDRPLADQEHLGKDRLDSAWAKAQYADLKAAHDALPPDLKALYRDSAAFFRGQQNDMARGLMGNMVEVALGHRDDALAGRVFAKTETDADKALLGDAYTDVKKAGALQTLKGPYFPLMRRGDHVVRGTLKVDAPKDMTGVRKLVDNQYEFSGKDARDRAIEYSKIQEQEPTTESVWVDATTGELHVKDPATGKDVKVRPEDTNAEQRFRVTVQNEFMDMMQGEYEARAAHQHYQNDPRVASVMHPEPRRLEASGFDSAVASGAIARMAKNLEKRQGYKDMSDAQKSEMKQMLNHLALQQLGSTRIQSKRLPRRNVVGENRDLVRNTLDYATSTSHYLAKLEHGVALEKAYKDMNDSVSGDDKFAYGRGVLANEFNRRRMESGSSPEGPYAPWVNRLISASYIKHLAGVSYSLMNMTQTGMISMPVIAARHGVTRTVTALSRAYSDISAGKILGQGLKDTVAKFRPGMTKTPNLLDMIKGSLKNADERRALDDLAKVGTIDPESGLEVGHAIRQTPGIGGKIDDVIGYFDNVARQMPRAIEAVNRSATAIAAYRLERARGADHDTAVRYAQDTVNNTHFLYSHTNQAPFMNHPLARVAFQFKKYAIGVYQLLGRQIGNAFYGATREQKIEGIKALVGLAATHMAMAGAMGLPTEPIKALFIGASFMGAPVGWQDVETWERKVLAGVAGQQGGEVLAHGLPRLAGFDISSRVGMDNLLTYGSPQSSKPNDMKGWLLDLFAGAPVSMLIDGGQGISQVFSGHVEQGMEKLVPVKAMADVMRAHREATEGKKTQAGRQTMTPYTPYETGLRAIGLTPRREAEGAEAAAAESHAIKDQGDRKSQLVQAWVHADNAADKNHAMVAIQNYNRGVPAEARIYMSSLTSAVKRDTKQGTGVATNKSNAYLKRDLDKVFNATP